LSARAGEGQRDGHSSESSGDMHHPSHRLTYL
jgi:hypothetical protein